jgi:hypothetical protein
MKRTPIELTQAEVESLSGLSAKTNARARAVRERLRKRGPLKASRKPPRSQKAKPLPITRAELKRLRSRGATELRKRLGTQVSESDETRYGTLTSKRAPARPPHGKPGSGG